MTAEEIVRKLTKAQREALMQGQAWSGDTAIPEPMRELRDMSLVSTLHDAEYNWVGVYLTSFGLSVRRLLENTHD